MIVFQNVILPMLKMNQDFSQDVNIYFREMYAD